MKDHLNPDNVSQVDEEQTTTFNMDEVDEKDAEFTPVPAGIYPCVVENTVYGKSSSGNLMISWTFKCIDPEHENRLFFYHTVTSTPGGRARTKKTLMRIAPEHATGNFNPETFCEEGHALGMECRVKVNIRPYQGEMRNNVVDVLAPDQEAYLGE